MSLCLLALGSNLGDRQHHLRAAVEALEENASVDRLSVSQSLENVSIGGPTGQGEFLNAAILVETNLSPRELLSLTQEIERGQGRKPSQKWDARPLDIDLILYDDLVIQTTQLTLPHPWLPVRRFVLEPAVQIASQLRHPVLDWSIDEMFQHLSASQRFVVIAGPYQDELSNLCAHLSCDYVPDPLNRQPAAAVPVTEQPIEFWQQRWDALVASSWCREQTSIISDFWVGHPPWKICQDLGSSEYPSLLQQRQVQAIVPPKLLINCRSSNDSCGSDNPGPGRKEFPWLNLTATSVERFRDEVSSAYLSMTDGSSKR